ncbi:MAG: hypothetical protein ACLU38_05685 [Dysosmobacter sp.]
MDGFGLRAASLRQRHPHCRQYPGAGPVFCRICPHQLSASGLDVGLPAGQMGNSEVGHTNIGAGRVVFQDLPRITKCHRRRRFLREPRLYQAPWTTA